MNFEHLIQINDLHNPLVETLSRDQVWQGLLHRVEDATLSCPAWKAAPSSNGTPTTCCADSILALPSFTTASRYRPTTGFALTSCPARNMPGAA